mmetsp:Transcript_11354/g.30045  ORF Transcript_11354/g.30045 Transcript_11354/m.30045 type:complete len:217 (-) Transcript_11354:366-1016(-)
MSLPLPATVTVAVTVTVSVTVTITAAFSCALAALSAAFAAAFSAALTALAAAAAAAAAAFSAADGFGACSSAEEGSKGQRKDGARGGNRGLQGANGHQRAAGRRDRARGTAAPWPSLARPTAPRRPQAGLRRHLGPRPARPARPPRGRPRRTTRQPPRPSWSASWPAPWPRQKWHGKWPPTTHPVNLAKPHRPLGSLLQSSRAPEVRQHYRRDGRP